MRQLDLFSGIGAFSLVAEQYGIETTCFVEIDPFCQAILKKNFNGVRIHDDVSTFSATRGEFDIITGGFPCQDISRANQNGRGLAGERSGLFFEIIRIVRQCQPRFFILENVKALLANGLDRVLCAIAEVGYDAEWQSISAASMGAPHRRERVFVIAYPQGTRRDDERAESGSKTRATSSSLPYLKDVPASRPEGRVAGRQFLRMDNGISYWVDSPHPAPLTLWHDRIDNQRVKALGNSIVPQCLYPVYDRIVELTMEGY